MHQELNISGMRFGSTGVIKPSRRMKKIQKARRMKKIRTSLKLRDYKSS